MYGFKIVVSTLIAIFMFIRVYAAVTDNSVKNLKTAVALFILEIMTLAAIWG